MNHPSAHGVRFAACIAPHWSTLRTPALFTLRSTSRKCPQRLRAPYRHNMDTADISPQYKCKQTCPCPLEPTNNPQPPPSPSHPQPLPTSRTSPAHAYKYEASPHSKSSAASKYPVLTMHAVPESHGPRQPLLLPETHNTRNQTASSSPPTPQHTSTTSATRRGTHS